MSLRSAILGCCVVLCATSTSASAQDLPKNADIENIGNRDITAGRLNSFSPEKEVAVGQQLAAEYEKIVQLNNDPVVNEYVNRLGQNLVLNSDARRFAVRFKVVDSADFDSRAFPGGVVYVNTGTIAALDNEAELAFVLSQQIAHIAARHGTEQLTKGQLVNVAAIPAVFQGGPGGFSVRQSASQLIPMSLMQFARKQASEADFLGLQYLFKAGYDPNAAVTFLQKVQAREPATSSKFFMTVPPASERIDAIRSEIASVLPVRTQNVSTTPEFDSIKAALKK